MTGLLQDKSVMITGAAAGIGLGIARVCAGAGASLVLADVNLEALVESSRSLAADSTRIQTVKLDVSNTTEVKQFFQDLAERCGGIDGLVNNAGVTIESEFLQFPEDEVERLWQTNLRSVFFMCQEAAKLMKSRRGGSIVNVASVHAIASRPGHEMYAATKGGIAAMTRAMSWSLGPYGIRVNSLSPGLTHTERIAKAVREHPDLEARFRAIHATGNYASVDEIGEVAAFLLSDNAGSVTGANIVADHGESALLVPPESLKQDSS